MKKHASHRRDLSSDEPTSASNVESVGTEQFIVSARSPGWEITLLSAVQHIAGSLIVILISALLTTLFAYWLTDGRFDGASLEILAPLTNAGFLILTFFIYDRLTRRKTEDVGKTVREHEKDFFKRVEIIINNHVRKAG